MYLHFWGISGGLVLIFGNYVVEVYIGIMDGEAVPKKCIRSAKERGL